MSVAGHGFDGPLAINPQESFANSALASDFEIAEMAFWDRSLSLDEMKEAVKYLRMAVLGHSHAHDIVGNDEQTLKTNQALPVFEEGFEPGVDAYSGWLFNSWWSPNPGPNGAWSASPSSEEAFTGLYSLKQVYNGQAGSGVLWWSANTFANSTDAADMLTDGTTYLASVWVKTIPASAVARAEFRINLGGDIAVNGLITQGSVPLTGGSTASPWQKLELQFVYRPGSIVQVFLMTSSCTERVVTWSDNCPTPTTPATLYWDELNIRAIDASESTLVETA